MSVLCDAPGVHLVVLLLCPLLLFLLHIVSLLLHVPNAAFAAASADAGAALVDHAE